MMLMIAAILWLLGSIFVLITMEAESGESKPILLLAAFWPFFTCIMIYQMIMYGDVDDSDDDNAPKA